MDGFVKAIGPLKDAGQVEIEITVTFQSSDRKYHKIFDSVAGKSITKTVPLVPPRDDYCLSRKQWKGLDLDRLRI